MSSTHFTPCMWSHFCLAKARVLSAPVVTRVRYSRGAKFYVVHAVGAQAHPLDEVVAVAVFGNPGGDIRARGRARKLQCGSRS